MRVAFGGYGERFVTFEVTEGVLTGVPVMMSVNRAVVPCAAGKMFCGVAINACDGLAVVQLAGYVRLSYINMIPAVGYQILVGDGVDKIKTDAAGQQLLVADVDTSTAICGVIL